MRSLTLIASCIAVLTGAALAGSAISQQPQNSPRPGWNGCCGVTPWPMGPGGKGRGMMWGGMGYMARRHQAMMNGIPAPYATMRNPLPITRATIDRGAKVYTKWCLSCHGQTGLGDGAAGHNLSPPPGNLAWLAQMPMSRWDGYIYWTVAEGGAPFGTAMPTFKGTLSSDEIWAVAAYIQAHLPQPAK